GDFQPRDLGIWPLHRIPISIYGRVNLISGIDLVPVPAAQVTMTRIWRTPPPPTVLNPPPDPFEVASLRPSLSAARPAGGGVMLRALNPVASTFQFLRPSEPGDSTVGLSNTTGLVAGDILAFDQLDMEHREFVAVTAILGSTGPTQPATARLRFRLHYPHSIV